MPEDEEGSIEETASAPTESPETASVEEREEDGPERVPMLKGNDIPWHAVEIIQQMPKDVKPLGFMQAQVNTIIVTADGFFGHYDGSVQELPVTLIDIP